MGSLEGTFDTKLHEAVRYGDIEEVKTALQQGYDPNLIGLYQWNCLHEAASNGEAEILQLLLKHKGDPNKKDLLTGYTPVHYAAKENHVDCLQMLLDGGGRYDNTSSDNLSCLDVAYGECHDILESQRLQDVKENSLNSDSKEKAETENETDNETDYISAKDSKAQGESHAEDVKPPAMGYIHLTFEHHSHKGTLNIRVWQISDLLLPPPSTSMINAVFVKSYIMPDKKKDSKRKTEEVRVERSEAHYHLTKADLQKGVQHVFSPSVFTFQKKLEYTGIKKEFLKDKSVQLEVCITQKYSRRTFLIGMFHMPLKEAVKKIVREKYPLIPCLNYTIPDNMKVYCASQLQIRNSKVFYSSPDVRNLSVSDMSESTDRAASDPDLQGIEVSKVTTSPSAIVTFSDQHLSSGAKTSNEKSRTRSGAHFDSEKSWVGLSRAIDIKVDGYEDIELKKKSAFTSVSMATLPETSIQSESYDSEKRDDENRSVKYDEILEMGDVKSKSQSSANAGSRPETPTWDYYDFDLQVVDIPIDEASPKKDGAAPVCLPMNTTLGLMSNRSSKRKNDNTKDKKKKKNTDNQGNPIPGKAVPVIVVTDTDLEPTRSRSSKKNGNRQKSPQLDAEDVLTSVISLKSKETITPRNITIDIDSDVSRSRTKGNQFQVIADVHERPHQSPVDEISLDIQDTDSFIVDLENLEDDLADSISLEQSESSVLSSFDHSLSSRKVKVSASQAVPQQVFIDDSLYESGEELSEGSYSTLPFVPLYSEDDVTEV